MHYNTCMVCIDVLLFSIGRSYQTNRSNFNRDGNNDMDGMNDEHRGIHSNHHADDDLYSDDKPLIFDESEQGFQDLLTKWKEIFSRGRGGT